MPEKTEAKPLNPVGLTPEQALKGEAYMALNGIMQTEAAQRSAEIAYQNLKAIYPEEIYGNDSIELVMQYTICNMMHLCDRRAVDWNTIIERGAKFYRRELLCD